MVGTMLKGYYTSFSYRGLVGYKKWMDFVSEKEYRQYMFWKQKKENNP